MRAGEVGIKLVVEVLDHYRGPDHKFRWLIAFAERASDKTRTGWPSRRLMSWRTEKSESRASHIAADLIDDGVIERTGGGGRHRGNASFILLPLAIPQGAPSAHPDKTPQGASSAHPDDTSQGAPATHSQGAPNAHPESDSHCLAINPHTTLTPPGGTTSAPTAQTTLAAFIDWDRANGGTLTRRTIGQLAKHIAALVDEGIDDRYIRAGLAAWREKGQHPATLDSFVSAAMNGQHRRLSTGDRAIAEAEQLKRELA